MHFSTRGILLGLSSIVDERVWDKLLKFSAAVEDMQLHNIQSFILKLTDLAFLLKTPLKKIQCAKRHQFNKEYLK
jgi:hypothetical protein